MIQNETKLTGIALGLAFATLTPAWAELVTSIALIKIPEGWATIFAAFIGLLGVAWASSQGYKNLILSNEDQQNRLLKIQKLEKIERKRVLAASLYGELRAYISAGDTFIKYYKHLMHPTDRTDMVIVHQYPKMDFHVFKASAGDIGLLGEELATSATSIFAHLSEWAQMQPINSPRNKAGEILAPQIETVEEMLRLVGYLGHQLAVVSGAQSEVIPLPIFERFWKLGRKSGTPAVLLFAVNGAQFGNHKGTP